MKAEYHFTITRTDRIYLISFVCLLLGWELIKMILPPGADSFSYVSPPVEKHRTGSQRNSDYTHEYFRKKKSIFTIKQDFEKKYSSYEDEIENTPPVSPIQIMNASIEDLTSIGINKKIAFHIQHFIASGGIIHNEKDLMKIYGMDSTQLQAASPFIIYAETADSNNLHNALNRVPQPLPQENIDLNTASIESLESLPGIGTNLATRIIKWRDAIGGFTGIEQVKECYGLAPETYEKIKDHLVISGMPRQLYINQIDPDSLKHPYLSKKMVRLIKAYKKQHGDFLDASQFRNVYPPDSSWCNKLLPYINFETTVR